MPNTIIIQDVRGDDFSTQEKIYAFERKHNAKYISASQQTAGDRESLWSVEVEPREQKMNNTTIRLLIIAVTLILIIAISYLTYGVPLSKFINLVAFFGGAGFALYIWNKK